VLSTGTTIDTLRFRTHIAAQLGVHPAAVEGLVVGEHGTSEVMLWSSVRVAGTPLADALSLAGRHDSLEALRRQIERSAVTLRDASRSIGVR
jgi:L-lactate dehydrogenase